MCATGAILLRVRWLLLALATIQPQSLGQTLCTTYKEVSACATYSTNATGHAQLETRLEQPENHTDWKLYIELDTSVCEWKASRVLTMRLDDLDSHTAMYNLDTVPLGYVAFPKITGFFRKAVNTATWKEARDNCSAEGASLIMPASKQEIEALYTAFRYDVPGGYENFTWLGASEIKKEGEYVTLRGEPLEQESSLTWTPGQPDGDTTENCLGYYLLVGMNDLDCSRRRPYFCKFIT